MADLVVLDFDVIDTADAVLTRLRLMRKQELINLLDAVLVSHPEGGDSQIKQSVNMTAVGAASGLSTGALVGALAGLLVLNPLGGMALGRMAGAAMGALCGRLPDFGINDDVIREVGQTIAEIREHWPRVLRTSLSNAQETALRHAPAAAEGAA